VALFLHTSPSGTFRAKCKMMT